jgi:hypothetical protein
MCHYPAYANVVRGTGIADRSAQGFIRDAIFRDVPQICEAPGEENHQFSDHLRCTLDSLSWSSFVVVDSSFPLIGELARRPSLVHVSSFHPRLSTLTTDDL